MLHVFHESVAAASDFRHDPTSSLGKGFQPGTLETADLAGPFLQQHPLLCCTISGCVCDAGSSPYTAGSSQHRHTVVHTAGEIEGLDDLHELLDLSLYHNQIEEIKGHLLS